MKRPNRARHPTDRRGSVTMMFAVAIIPIMMLIGIAIDFAWVMQARSQLDLAADSAAIAAARDAAQVYAAGYTYTSGQPQTPANNIPVQFGISAGNQWWVAQTAKINAANNWTASPTQVVQNGQNFTATVTWTAHVQEILPNLLHSALGYELIGNSSIATVTVNQYGAIDLLLDNTSSMMLAVDSTNQTILQTAVYNFLVNTTVSHGVTTHTANLTNAAAVPDGNEAEYLSNGVYATTAVTAANVGQWSPATMCAFACHWSSTGSTSNITDYYWAAKAAGATLRFDVVNQAATTAITNMQTLEATSGQLSLGVYSFGGPLTGVNTSTYAPYFTTVYPETTIDQTVNGVVHAGLGATQAIAAINLMTPPVTGDTPETNVSYGINGLLNVLGSTVSGNGGTRATAKRSVIIVTDGMEDDNPAGQTVPTTEGPISPAICNGLKNKGITVYILYTTYLDQLIDLPFGNIALLPYIDGSASNDLLPALTACASSSSDIIQASSQSDIQSAMTTLVDEAVANSIRITN